VAGDPAAPARYAELGLDHVAVAAAYHGVRALTPRHPGHRVVTAPHGARYYPAPFDEVRAALGEAGLAVYAWVVVNHVDLPEPSSCVVNAFGDLYPWALCPAQDATLDRALRLVGEVAARPGIVGVELEACGWYGFDHQGTHDKTAGVRRDAATGYLMSLCFCAACERLYPDPVALRQAVREALADDVSQAAGGALDELLDPVRRVRREVADRFRAAVVARIRDVDPALRVLLHTNPDPDRAGAYTGADPATAASLVDGRVVNCWADLSTLRISLATPGPVHAGLMAVSAMGGRPLQPQIDEALSLGASGIRLYHAGLASTADLAAIRSLDRTWEAR
jgi:hypothetical protein